MFACVFVVWSTIVNCCDVIVCWLVCACVFYVAAVCPVWFMCVVCVLLGLACCVFCDSLVDFACSLVLLPDYVCGFVCVCVCLFVCVSL